ncbi:hypothetical protein CAPTEDRAFT_104201 [Capitella teleta]|uniref:G-protein coupled receptors family 1 profile domain-containing protein n=1 Tax=Capitella teleta TaxID=283909 RepID=R7VBH4_CAPTE|nr:hypothetical protein CAPTEDRAFT_104201 [Capitella teleta]|eukprot:ELU15984.1 hypothetical protein CAPTEDRAFT_104201 [Capitella teleta]
MVAGDGSFTSKVILLPIRLILIAVIILGNVTTVKAIFKNRRLQTNTNLILCSLGVCDIINAFGLFGFIVRTFVIPELNCSNIYIHDLLNVLEIIPIAISLSHLVAIAIDRYVAIIWPFQYSQHFDQKMIFALIISSWITGVLMLTTYGWWFINWDPTSCRSPIPAVFDYIIKGGFQFTMTPLLLILYVQIFNVSRQQRRKIHAMDVQMTSQQSSDQEKQNKSKRKEYKAAVLTLVVSLVATGLWTPYFILTAIVYLGFTSPLINVFLQIAIGLGYCNSAVNFFIYVLMNSELRLAFREIWGIRRPSNAGGPNCVMVESADRSSKGTTF